MPFRATPVARRTENQNAPRQPRRRAVAEPAADHAVVELAVVVVAIIGGHDLVAVRRAPGVCRDGDGIVCRIGIFCLKAGGGVAAQAGAEGDAPPLVRATAVGGALGARTDRCTRDVRRMAGNRHGVYRSDPAGEISVGVVGDARFPMADGNPGAGEVVVGGKIDGIRVDATGRSNSVVVLFRGPRDLLHPLDAIMTRQFQKLIGRYLDLHAIDQRQSFFDLDTHALQQG